MEPKTYQAAGYDTDLSDAQWALIEPFLFPTGAPRRRGRFREPHAARACLDANLYLLKSGCQWALLPKEFPPKSTVHDAFAQWTQQGVWPRINEVLRGRVRAGLKKTPCPAQGSSTVRASRAGNSPPQAAATTRAKKSRDARATR